MEAWTPNGIESRPGDALLEPVSAPVRVDIDTLQKFADTLNERIDQTSLMLQHAGATDGSLPLGAFAGARATAGRHADAKSAYTEQVRALHDAMVKARTATLRILT